MDYKFLKHTADIKFRAYGKTIEKAFENSALAMFNAMYLGKIKPMSKKNIQIKSKDKESLLYGFLEELLVLLDSKNFFLSKASVSIDDNELKAVLFGDNAKNYPINLQVKAVTYNNMIIKKTRDRWMCQVVLDV